MSNYGEWQESKKEYKQAKRKERQKGQLKALKWFAIIVIPLFILLLIGLSTGAIKPQSAQNASSATDQKTDKQDFTPLAQNMRVRHLSRSYTELMVLAIIIFSKPKAL